MRSLNLSRPIFVEQDERCGTAGCVVRKGDKRYVLTCRHVVVGTDGPAEGVQVRMKCRLMSPPIGKVAAIGAEAGLAGDYALVELMGRGLELSAKLPAGIGRISGPPLSHDEIRIGMKVQKCGAASGRTIGEVSAISMSMRDQREHPTLLMRIVPFYDAQRRRERFDWFCRRGDSGSVVVSYARPHRPIGLLQERDSGVIGRGFATSFAEVQAKLGFELE